MTEAFRTKGPYFVDFEETLFQTEENGIALEIPIANFEEIEKAYVIYTTGREVVVRTKIHEEGLAELKITLHDHGILFDRIETKPTETQTENNSL